MSMLQGKQMPGTGDTAIAIATASINAVTRIVLAIGPITFSKLPSLLLYDNHSDHTRLFMRKAKVAVGARHRERVAVIAAPRDEARVQRRRAFWHRSILGGLGGGRADRAVMRRRAVVNPFHGVADFYRDFFGRVERLLVSHLDHDRTIGCLRGIGQQRERGGDCKRRN